MSSRERPSSHDSGPKLYCRAAWFQTDDLAGRAYFRAQRAILQDDVCDLSVYRLLLHRVWHVAVLGEQPRRDLEERLDSILSQGQPASLPVQVLEELQRRRALATKLGP